MRSVMKLWVRKQVNALGRRNERRVNYVICGTQKGGTSALNAYLKEHPEICVAEKKEVQFFDNEALFAKGKPDYAIYHSAFKPQAAHQLIGEATPTYMYWQDAPRRIWEYNPDMKLIVLLRNPITRAYSQWNMAYSRKAEPLSLEEAIRTEPERCREALPYQHRVYSYVGRGFYLEQLRRIWRYFPKKNVLVLKNEYLKEQPAQALGEVCAFLGVSPFARVEDKEVFARPYSSKMSEESRNALRAIFEYEVRGLERELGWDCSKWLAE